MASFADGDPRADKNEAREIADAAMRRCVSRGEGVEGINLADPRDAAYGVAATMWLAAEVRAARLERACEVG